MDRTIDSAYLGLSGAELAKLEERDKLAAEAYRSAVRDGTRLSDGHQHLWNVSLGLDAPLFLASLGGFWLCRRQRYPTTTPTDDESSTDVS